MGLFTNTSQFDAQVRSATDGYVGFTGLSGDEFFALAKGIIMRESSFNPNATHVDSGETGDGTRTSYGLMQVEGSTARAFGFAGAWAQLFDPGTNILLGVRVLADNLQTSGGVVDAAVSAYNAGFSALRPGDGKRNADGTFINQSYVNDVLRYRDQFLSEVQTSNAGAVVAATAGIAPAGWAGIALLIGGGLLALLMGRR